MLPNFIGVAGLPRAGSTLLCRLLATHPEIHWDGRDSPLCNLLLDIRRTAKDDASSPSRPDGGFEEPYGRLQSAMMGILRGWQQDAGNRKAVVGRSCAWLDCIDMLLALAPEARLIVCLRELGQIYGSIEARHQETVLRDFVDPVAGRDRSIGTPLSSVHAVPDLPSELRERIYFLRFEDMTEHTTACMSDIFQWLGLSTCGLDPERLFVRQPARHEVPPRIQARIESACAWYYRRFNYGPPTA